MIRNINIGRFWKSGLKFDVPRLRNHEHPYDLSFLHPPELGTTRLLSGAWGHRQDCRRAIVVQINLTLDEFRIDSRYRLSE